MVQQEVLYRQTVVVVLCNQQTTGTRYVHAQVHTVQEVYRTTRSTTFFFPSYPSSSSLFNQHLYKLRSIAPTKMDKAALLVLFALPLSVAFLNPASRKRFISRLSSSPTTLDPQTIKSLNGKSAVLTGASSGLGRSLAILLADCNLKHLVLSGRNVDALEEVKAACEGINKSNEVHVLPCDLSDIDSSAAFAQIALEKCENNIDLLVLNGGMSSRSSFLDTNITVDQLLMNVNYLSGAAISKGIVPSMVSRKSGAIVWISSVQGKIGTPFRTSYAASKFAVQGYCEALRSELASSGVTVHCVSPGYINTNLSKNAATGDGSKHGKLDEATANGAEPSDVAGEILDKVITSGESDFLVAATVSAKAAIALKFLAPHFLEKKLVKRFVKASKEK